MEEEASSTKSTVKTNYIGFHLHFAKPYFSKLRTISHNTDDTTRKMARALRIVRDNLQLDELIDDYTIFCYFAPCQCKVMGFWFIGEGLCTRFDEIKYG